MEQITFYVGTGESKTGAPLPAEFVSSAAREAREFLAREFGGFTEYQHNGGWIGPDKRLVSEPGLTFVVLSEDGERAKVKAAAVELCALFFQNCVLVVTTRVEAEFVG